MEDKSLSDLLIKQKVEKAQLDTEQLVHHADFLKQLRRSIFTSINIVSSQISEMAQFDDFLQQLEHEVEEQFQVLAIGETRCQELAKALFRKQKQIAELQATIKLNSDVQQVTTDKIAVLEAEEAAVKEQIDCAKNILFRSSERLAATKGDYSALHLRLTQQRGLFEEHQERIKRNQFQIDELKGLISKAHLDIEELHNNSMLRSDEITAQMQTIEKNQLALKDLQHEYTVFAQQLKMAENKHSQYLARIDDQNNLISIQYKEMERIKVSLSETRFLLDGQEVSIAQNECKIAEQKRLIEQKKNQVNQQARLLQRNKQVIEQQEKYLENNLKKLHIAQNQINDESIELNMQKISLKHNRSSIVALKSTIREEVENLRTIRDQITTNQHIYSTQKISIEQYRQQITVLEQQVSSETLRLNELNTEYKHSSVVEEEVKERVEKLEAENSELNLKNQELQRQADLLSQNIELHQHQIESLESAIEVKKTWKTQQQEITNHQAVDLKKRQEQIHAYSIVNAQLGHQLELLQLEIAKQESGLHVAKNRLYQGQREFENYSSSLAILDQQVVQNTLELQSLEKEIEAYAISTDRATSERSEKESQLSLLYEQIDSKKRESTLANEVLQQQTAAIELLRRDLDDSQRSLDKLRLYCEQTDELVGEQQDVITRYQAEYRLKLHEKQHLEQTLSDLQVELENQNRQILDIERARASTQMEVTQTTKTITRLLEVKNVNQIKLSQQETNIVSLPQRSQTRTEVHPIVHALQLLLPPSSTIHTRLLSESSESMVLICKNFSLSDGQVRSIMTSLKQHIQSETIRHIALARDSGHFVVGMKFSISKSFQSLYDLPANILVA